MKPDYYHVLGVSPEASLAEIRLAWRTLARRSHPDRNRSDRPEPECSMRLLNEAWEILSSRSRRRAYDLSRRVPEPSDVQDAVLAAARLVVASRGWAATESGGDVLLRNGEVRLVVRYLRTLSAAGLSTWLPSVAVLAGRTRIECAVLVACRVVVPRDAMLNLKAGPVPRVAIDLIESRIFGEFPSGVTEEPFLPFLIE